VGKTNVLTNNLKRGVFLTKFLIGCPAYLKIQTIMANSKKGGIVPGGKYIIQKTDGTPVEESAWYFLLRIDKDPHARVGLLAYIESVRSVNPELAFDLEAQLKRMPELT